MEEVEGDGRATSADKVLILLVELARRGSIRVHEAAEYLGSARSTAHRLLATLVRNGMAEQDGSGGSYRPGPGLRSVVAPTTRSSLLVAAQAAVLAMRDETTETSHFAILQGNSIRFVTGYEGLHEDHTPSRVGLVLPAHATAVGKAILAALPPEALRDLYPRGVQVLTGATLGTQEEIHEHLRMVARRGYATNNSESDSDITAVAVVVRDVDGIPIGSLAVAGPPERLPAARIPHVVARMQRAALDIQAALLAPARQ
jgi:DNA-binding IclR family transcriptional regulator